MIYKAILGKRYIIDDFIDTVELRLDHETILPAKVYKLDGDTVIIDTELLFAVGQPVSMGGYPTGSNGNRNFRLLEVSITNTPVLEKAMITEIVYDSNDNLLPKPTITSIIDGSYLDKFELEIPIQTESSKLSDLIHYLYKGE